MTTPDTEGEVILAPEGTPLAIFQKERTDAISEMFDNEDEYGIFPTGKFYARLDKCVESLLTSHNTHWKERAEEAYEWGVKQTIAQFLRMNLENPKAPVNVDEVKRRALNERV